jgi:hypothetical protein
VGGSCRQEREKKTRSNAECERDSDMITQKERGGFLAPLAAKGQLFDNPIFCRITCPDLIAN